MKNVEMTMNGAGQMESDWNCELENKSKDIKCHAPVIMPNHIPSIIEKATADIRSVVQWFKTMTTNEHVRGLKLGKCPRAA